MSDYPVVFEATRPAQYERAQVAIRLLILLVLGALGGSIGWLYLVLYLVLPLLAAAWLGGRHDGEFVTRGVPTLANLVRWVVAFLSYLAFLTDEFPGDARTPGLEFHVMPCGRPTLGSALRRLIASLPGFLVGGLVGLCGALVSVLAAVYVLIDRRVPASIYDFQRGVVRWQARLFAFHASLVDTPPPLTLDRAPHDAMGPGAASP